MAAEKAAEVKKAAEAAILKAQEEAKDKIAQFKQAAEEAAKSAAE